MSALSVNGYELVVSAISENLTWQKAIGRLAHNLRESSHAKRIKYLRRSSKANKYFAQNQFGSLVEATGRSFDGDEISNMVKDKMNVFRADYERQTITDKNGKVKKRAWQKKMTPFTEILITFGTTRPKEEKEGLNPDETYFINSLNMKNMALKFVNKYCLKYGAECISVAEHNDEKVKHFQIIFTNYDLAKHACIRRNRQQMKQFGSSLQDMAADAFSQIAVRGVRGSIDKHKTLKQMHQAECEFQSEQELNKQLQRTINQTVSKFITKNKHFLGDEYYEIDPGQYGKLIKAITNLVLEKFQDKIKIISQVELKEQIEQMSAQLIKNGEILEENTKLADENEQLKQENANLLNQDNVIKDLSEKVAFYEENFGDTDKALEELKAIDKIKAENKELKNLREFDGIRIDNLELQISKKDKLIDELSSEIKPLQEKVEQIDSLNQQITKMKDEKDELTSQNQTLNIQKEKLQGEIDKQNEELIELRSFRDRAINFLIGIARKVPIVKDYIEHEFPNIAIKLRKERERSGYSIKL